MLMEKEMEKEKDIIEVLKVKVIMYMKDNI